MVKSPKFVSVASWWYFTCLRPSGIVLACFLKRFIMSLCVYIHINQAAMAPSRRRKGSGLNTFSLFGNRNIFILFVHVRLFLYWYEYLYTCVLFVKELSLLIIFFIFLCVIAWNNFISVYLRYWSIQRKTHTTRLSHKSSSVTHPLSLFHHKCQGKTSLQIHLIMLNLTGTHALPSPTDVLPNTTHLMSACTARFWMWDLNLPTLDWSYRNKHLNKGSMVRWQMKLWCAMSVIQIRGINHFFLYHRANDQSWILTTCY